MSQKKLNDVVISKETLQREYAFNEHVNYEKRIIVFSGDIEEHAFAFIETALTELERESRSKITIKINSPGGYVYEALAIVGRIKASPCMIVTEGYGQIMSAAVVILASGDKRKMSKYAFAMHHEIGAYEQGKLSELKNNIKHLNFVDNKWAEIMEEFTGTSRKFWKKLGVGVDAYLTAEECLKHGIIDEII